MKSVFISIIGISLLVACQKEPEELNFRSKFYEKQSKITSVDVAETSGFNTWGVFLSPNTFTPNGDGINDHFQIIYRFSDTLGNTSEPRYFKIYDCKKNLIRRLRTFSWDGADEDGLIEGGEYGYEAAIKLSTGETIIAHGHMLSMLDCLEKQYEVYPLLFPDQFHPRIGIIYPTQEVVVTCD